MRARAKGRSAPHTWGQNRQAVRFDFTKILRKQTTISACDRFIKTSWKQTPVVRTTLVCAHSLNLRVSKKNCKPILPVGTIGSKQESNAFRIEGVCNLASGALAHFRLVQHPQTAR